ncbi:hypothetical protein O181_037593 [Austropuccinia psidii MF-1]|uniref:Uncharacterized protein n=1 Tax=Austropuccinia psidii MF-1 TaxID=1389203 RepID=A0A9Q3DBQ6_9BASI|nr:hypothetical protein [Austropuccinia psidii MF-1]
MVTTQSQTNKPEQTDPSKNNPKSESSSSLSATIKSSSNDFLSTHNLSFIPSDVANMPEIHDEDKDAIIQRLQRQLKLLQAQSGQDNNFFYKRFMKDLISFINNLVILSHDGSKFEEWKDGLNLLLEMVFPPTKNYCDDMDNFESLKPLEEMSLRNLFHQNVHHALNWEKFISSFEDLSSVIKDEINNTKQLEDTNANGSIMALQTNSWPDYGLVFPQQTGIYQHPHASSLPPSQNIIQRYGSKCAYCQKEGHWYVDLAPTARTSIRTAQLDTYNSEPEVIHAQHITDVNDNQILLDSSALAHVRGRSPFLFDVIPLSRPISLLLADPTTVLHATGIGQLCILLKEGELNVDNVYVLSSISGKFFISRQSVIKWFFHDSIWHLSSTSIKLNYAIIYTIQ